jgi:hypothetical protein
MNLQSWLFNLTPGNKLIVGLLFGIFCYIFLRGLIYLANKAAKKAGVSEPKKNLSQADKLERLMAN